MADTNETIADLIAEKRRQADKIERNCAEMMKRGKMISDCYARELVADIRREADRIEAAHKRERGDAAKLRKAVDYLCERMADIDATFDPSEVECLRAALAARPRNCDIGSAEEQAERFTKVCTANSKDGVRGLCSETCPFSRDYQGECALVWSQMPYEEGGAK